MDPRELSESEKEEFAIFKVLEDVERVGKCAGSILDKGCDLERRELCLLQDIQTLGARAELYLLEKMEAERRRRVEALEGELIFKSLSKTDVESQLTLTTVKGKLDELCAVWGQHGRRNVCVTDLTDSEVMEFAFGMWSHHKGSRAVWRGAWKYFCQKHGLREGDVISISYPKGNQHLLRAGKDVNDMVPLALLTCEDRDDEDLQSGMDYEDLSSTTEEDEKIVASLLFNMRELA